MTEFTLEEVASLIVKQPAEFLATLKSEDGEWKPKDEILSALKKADKERLETIAKDQSGKSVRLRMKQAQNYIRENFGVESDASEIEDHLKLLVENIKGKAGKEKVVEKLIDLTEDSAIQHPVVKELLKKEVPKHTAELQKALDEERKKFKDYLEKDNLKKLDDALVEEAAKVLRGAKAALDKDEAIQQKQIKRFVAGLKADFKFKLDDNGKPIPVDKDDEPMQEGYVEVTYADLVKRENIFGVHQFDPEKSSPSATSQPTPTATTRYTGSVPKTLEELNKALKELPGMDNKSKREQLMQAFDQAQKAAVK